MKRNRPAIIGVTGPAQGGKILWHFTKLAVKLGGGKARPITSDQPVPFDQCDGFIITGGGDINPQRYGEAAARPDLHYDLARDQLEHDVIQYAVTHGRPLLGICRGMQMINVSLGGSLFQEASYVLEDFLPNNTIFSKIVGRREIQFIRQSRLFSIMGSYPTYRVNSIHHQAVNRLGAGLTIVAKEENGLVQAIEQAPDNPHPFLIGVQWHPELMLHAPSARSLFKALADAC